MTIEDIELALEVGHNKINDHLEDLKMNYDFAFKELKKEIKELKNKKDY